MHMINIMFNHLFSFLKISLFANVTIPAMYRTIAITIFFARIPKQLTGDLFPSKKSYAAATSNPGIQNLTSQNFIKKNCNKIKLQKAPIRAISSFCKQSLSIL